jgi:Golgi SNAP receptor complex protein 2
MESLYHKTKSCIHQVQETLKNFELSSTQDEIKTISNQFSIQIDEILSNLDKLDIFVNKEPVSRRTDAKIKVDELKYDLKHIQAAFRSIQYRK